MGTNRILIIVGVALFAGLPSIGAQAQTEPKATASSTPLALAPVATKTTQARSTKAEARKPARPSTRRTAPAEPASDVVMRGPDNVALIARLPWWRSDEMQTIRYLDKAVASQVLTAADSWRRLSPDPMDEDANNDARTMTQVATAVEGGAVTAPGELNAIDLAAGERAASEPPPANKSWLQGLLALLGGALAAASTARFLFV